MCCKKQHKAVAFAHIRIAPIKDLSRWSDKDYTSTAFLPAGKAGLVLFS
ncbi:hypothetical protein Pedsa_1150 [Pseudopedobacter saltans DSM 12145]|uniref:Uncharacterized protein n=1 Tax=Pseudopedobacter saltans (strain ATCC 51119 / DSM 12145 / JCM 21818 / CCUG 39354 / LMG 10337 / NBRC 100064 / NCIMB 13643) TaxID=762903 RepID=F0SCC2_PSESL|nr:hypothetical protein [Pseudopedobacter saltans]ADY51719.1 hypothetical protein Pedsa_1150 [Pseudopedobacter saltans DSM 12145]